MPFKNFANAVLYSSEVNAYLARQAVIRVDTLTERDAIASPEPGMFVHVLETGLDYRWSGSVWRAMAESGTYTPTFANLTVGTGGSVAGAWTRIGDMVHLRARATLGTSGFSVTGPVDVSLPSGLTATDPFYVLSSPLGIVSAWDNSATLAVMGAVTLTGTTNQVRLRTPAGAAYSSTQPFTWAANDRAEINLTYRRPW